jgi:hypothetical protein
MKKIVFAFLLFQICFFVSRAQDHGTISADCKFDNAFLLNILP